MASIIALLSCRADHVGPWIRSQGRETGVKVYPELGEGEVITVEQELADRSAAALATTVRSGITSLSLCECYRYRVVKRGSKTPTTVEILLNGKSRS